MKQQKKQECGRLELSVNSEHGEMDRVNEILLGFLEARGVPAVSKENCSMVVCELVGNSLKYGLFMKPEDVVTISVEIDEASYSVSVTNPVDRRAHAYLEELDRIVQQVHGFQDPFEAYLERIQETSRTGQNSGKSGLGIARISYEGQAALDFFLGDDNTLTVSASSKYK